MTRHSASRDVLYSTPPGPDEETADGGSAPVDGSSEGTGPADATEESRDETPAPSVADD